MRYLKQHPLICFLIIHFLVWSLIPLLRRSLPMDSIEAVVWGEYCDWGTNKHPPFSGWLAYAFYLLGDGAPYAVYALSQVCVAVGFVYIFRLAACFYERPKAVLSVMLLEGVIYYGYSAPEFNVNVVSLALWPMVSYYFYQSLKTDKLSDWVLLGVACGLNLLNKYVGGFLLAAIGLVMIFEPFGRQKLKSVGPYLSALIALAVVAPHVLWLYEHDFFVLDYFLGRSAQGAGAFSWLGHLVYPLKFAASQILFSLGTLLIYFWATHLSPKDDKILGTEDRRLIVWLGVVPFLLMFAFSALTGVRLKSMWGFPVLYMSGILLWNFWPYRLSDKLFERMQKGVYAVMLLMAVALACVFMFNKSDKVHLDAESYGRQVENLWRQTQENRPFQYVAGEVWWADNAALFAPSRPKPLIWGDVKKNPWFEAADVARQGALLIAAGQAEYENLARAMGAGEPVGTFEIELKNLIGKTKRKTLYYGFYLGENKE